MNNPLDCGFGLRPITQQDDNCNTALFWAANRGRHDLLPLLIQHGAGVSSASKTV